MTGLKDATLRLEDARSGMVGVESSTLTQTLRARCIFNVLGENIPLDLVDITPWGLAAQWLTSKEEWMQVKAMVELNNPPPSSWVDRILFNLYRGAKSYEEDLATDLQRESEFNIAFAAFSDRLPERQNIHTLGFLAAAFRLLVMDRLLHFKQNVGPDKELTVAVNGYAQVQIAEHCSEIAPYVEACAKWDTNLEGLQRAWVESSQPPQDAGSIARADPLGDPAVKSLVALLTVVEGRGYVGKVEANFSLAALALRAMILVRISNLLLCIRLLMLYRNDKRGKKLVWPST